MILTLWSVIRSSRPGVDIDIIKLWRRLNRWYIYLLVDTSKPECCKPERVMNSQVPQSG